MQRNILMIVVDDLRPELGCYGKTKLKTPFLDSLATTSAHFSRAYCQVPICMPSRASVLSGVRPNETWRDRVGQMCPNGEPSLPGYLRERGYETVSVGKVYHYNHDDEASWTRRYKDTFYESEYVCDGYCSGYQLQENREKLRNFRRQFQGEKVDRPSRVECVDASDSAYPDGRIAEIAIGELRSFRSSRRPFFLSLGFYRPHRQWAVPKRYWNLYNRDEVDLAVNQFLPENAIGKSDMNDFLHYGDPETESLFSDLGSYTDDLPVLSEEKQRESVHGYWSSVSFVDAQIGRVLNELDQLRLRQSTIIVLWGDNGWHLGEHLLWSKTTSFEESTRVPLMVGGPGVIPGRRNALVELVDIYPTICELASQDVPGHLEGDSMMPLLLQGDQPWKTAVFSRIWDASTVRSDRYRLTHYSQATREGDLRHVPSDGSIELFDLRVDPAENRNIADEQPETGKTMLDVLDGGWTMALPPPYRRQGQRLKRGMA